MSTKIGENASQEVASGGDSASYLGSYENIINQGIFLVACSAVRTRIQLKFIIRSAWPAQRRTTTADRSELGLVGFWDKSRAIEEA